MLIITNKVNRKRFNLDLSLFLNCEKNIFFISNHLQLLESQQRSIWF
jgi:hypothetical protein